MRRPATERLLQTLRALRTVRKLWKTYSNHGTLHYLRVRLDGSKVSYSRLLYYTVLKLESSVLQYLTVPAYVQEFVFRLEYFISFFP